MRLVVTIYERTVDDGVRTIRALDPRHDMVEVRVDAFGGGDPERFRDITSKPILFTNRGGEPVDAGFGLIDVEWGRRVSDPARTVLSFHDFEGIPQLPSLIEEMLSRRCAFTKIAVTPRNFRENELLLELQRPGLTLFGMGEHGLYSRILAPFFGSELAFVSVDEARGAAPGQMSLEKAIAIYGDRASRPAHVFAVVGNPAGHSLSPVIHNPLFRRRGVAAAYAIASVESFDEVIEAFQAKRLTGLSVTAPFKDDAFAFAERTRAAIGPNAGEARAVNTLVNTKEGVIADNTDVDGFEELLRGIPPQRAAVIGAGGTGRAAAIALRRSGFDVTVFNRTPRDGAEPLDALARFGGDLIVNTLPSGAAIALPRVKTIIESAYGGQGAAGSGLQLLRAQAARQNTLFLRAFD